MFVSLIVAMEGKNDYKIRNATLIPILCYGLVLSRLTVRVILCQPMEYYRAANLSIIAARKACNIKRVLSYVYVRYSI